MGLTLDTGALIALERGSREVEHLVRRVRLADQEVTLPTPVLAQFWRGSWLSVEFRRLMERAKIEPTSESLAREAGELLGRCGQSDVVDAIVVCSAARRGDRILTSDPVDLERLAQGYPGVRIVAI